MFSWGDLRKIVNSELRRETFLRLFPDDGRASSMNAFEAGKTM